MQPTRRAANLLDRIRQSSGRLVQETAPSLSGAAWWLGTERVPGRDALELLELDLIHETDRDTEGGYVMYSEKGELNYDDLDTTELAVLGRISLNRPPLPETSSATLDKLVSNGFLVCFVPKDDDDRLVVAVAGGDYAMTVGMHLQWCAWCAQQDPDETV